MPYGSDENLHGDSLPTVRLVQQSSDYGDSTSRGYISLMRTSRTKRA